MLGFSTDGSVVDWSQEVAGSISTGDDAIELGYTSDDQLSEATAWNAASCTFYFNVGQQPNSAERP